MADDQLMDQDEIERLLNQAQADPAPQGGAGGAASETSEPSGAASAGDGGESLLGQEDIEKLLTQAGTKLSTPTSEAARPQPSSPASLAADGSVAESDVEYLLNQAEQALESIDAASNGNLPEGVNPYRLEEFSGAPASTENATLDLIRDVGLDLKIELGRTHMYLEDVLKLRKGSVVPLDKLAGDPVDIHVNGRLIAQGEVLVLNDNFCVRVTQLIAGTNALA